MQIQIINRSPHPLPAYQTQGAAGMDIHALVAEDIILEPLQRALIPTGLYIALPVGYEAQIRPRSGMAIKQGITCLNTPGTIDSDYRGEIKVVLINLSNEEQRIKNGDRIAQMVITNYTTAEWIPVNVLEESNRGASGFGSTGNAI